MASLHIRKKHKIYTEGCTSGSKRGRGTITSEKPLQFIPWLRRQLENEKVSVLKRLAGGPVHNVISYKAYRANGFVFHTKGSESNTTTQNSGVTMKAIMTFISRKGDPNGLEDETTVKPEDWERFHELQREPRVIARRKRGKIARKAMKRLHTSGKRESGRIVKRLRKKNLKVPVFRTDVYLVIYTRADRSSLTSELDVELEKIRNICIVEPEIVSLDIDNNLVAQVCDINYFRRKLCLTLEEDLVHVEDKLTTMDEKLSSLAAERQATSGSVKFNGTKMQLGLSIKSQTATLLVKKRLAYEQLSYFTQISVLTRDYELYNHNMFEAFTFFGLAYMSQLAYVNLLNSKVILHFLPPNCSLLMATVIDMLIFQEYIICQEFLGISKFKHENTKCPFSMRNRVFKEDLASEIVVMDGESYFITDSNL
ncbi:hypothetical protein GIB67_019677, partial [Kingdonia uniflora]